MIVFDFAEDQARGSVSRKQADDKAAAECNAFAARWRAAAEVQGEAGTFKALDEAARQLPKRAKGKPAKGGDE